MKSIIQSAIKHLEEERRAPVAREPGRVEKERARIAREFPKCAITVIGIGGAGCNIVGRMMRLGIQGVECIAVSTDGQHLASILAHRKILIGEKTIRGFDERGDPEHGAADVEESRLIISQALEGADMVFVVCGLGGETGTGGAPVVAELAKQFGALVIGVTTLPFKFEGKLRNTRAIEGLSKLREHVDTVIVVDNNKLLEIAPDYPPEEGLAIVNEVLATTVKVITETIKLPSLIRLDFSDIRSIMRAGGLATIGIGEAEGENRAERSAEDAWNSPLHSFDITGATAALIHVSGGPDMTFREATRAAELAGRKMAPYSKVIWSVYMYPNLSGAIRTILLVAGIKDDSIPELDATEIKDEMDEMGRKVER